MNKFDFKKKYKDLYAPTTTPSLITVPAALYLMVDGKGNPNDPNGEYPKAIELLYSLSYSIKMSLKKEAVSGISNEDYVVAPLEGLWWLNNQQDTDFTKKENFYWTSMIRQPDFITDTMFHNACASITKKKPEFDVTKARLRRFQEGLCAQIMHNGPYDEEPVSIHKLDCFIKAQGYQYDIGNPTEDGMIRRHHEIYLNDFRKTSPEKLKTIIRHPIR
ncbi:MAG: hypothetical protein K0S47_1349 [Herbinix sp.]|nr:hypothetical protein [Herbinix sp.]